MAKLVKKNYSKRIIFPLGEQQQFLLKALHNLSFSWASFADKIKIHRRTLNDWKREEYSMPLNVVKKISVVAKLKMPKSAEIKNPFWYVYKGAKIGGKMGAIACFKKYGSYGGNPEYRKKKWYEWWEREGKYKSNIINVVKPIKKPDFSKKLAEFVGIILGDGSIGKSQISITLHSEDDKEYSKFVVNLIKKLFNVYVGTCYRKDSKAISYNVSRTELIHFCTEELGLKQGNKIKQQVDIPDWIKENKLYSIACVRGLVDTDGCIFTHRYKVNGKFYSYKKLSFKSSSKPMITSVYKILENEGIKPRIAQNNVDLRLESIKDIRRYFQIFNSHNPKHLKRFEKIEKLS